MWPPRGRHSGFGGCQKTNFSFDALAVNF
uniref:Uncharacterized protein n=1 Tax=Arundo donax TaxID=35708 RepID=A0A0A9EPN7_ARUDO